MKYFLCDKCKNKTGEIPIGVYIEYENRPLNKRNRDAKLCPECAKKLMIEYCGDSPLRASSKLARGVDVDPVEIRVTGAEIESYRAAGFTWDWISHETQTTIKTLKKIYNQWQKEIAERIYGKQGRVS